MAKEEDIAVICEDDMLINADKVRQDWEVVMIANTVPDGWGVLRIGQHKAVGEYAIGEGHSLQLTTRVRLLWKTHRFGNYGYIITPVTARAMLDELSKQPLLFDKPSDIWITMVDINTVGDVKSIDPSLIKYRTDVVSTTQAE